MKISLRFRDYTPSEADGRAGVKAPEFKLTHYPSVYSVDKRLKTNGVAVWAGRSGRRFKRVALRRARVKGRAHVE
jgi:hypothetical protein